MGIMAMNSTRRHRPCGPIFASDWYEYSAMPIGAEDILERAWSLWANELDTGAGAS